MDMNNEPVAWYSQRRQYFWTAKPTDDNSQDAVPLYTHPANLTGVEIAQIAVPFYDEENLIANEFGFARAILKKAREK